MIGVLMESLTAQVNDRSKVRPSQMNAVVPQEHTAAVRFISLTREIAGLCGGDLHGSTES